MTRVEHTVDLFYIYIYVCVCVCVCVRARVLARARAFVFVRNLIEMFKNAVSVYPFREEQWIQQKCISHSHPCSPVLTERLGPTKIFTTLPWTWKLWAQLKLVLCKGVLTRLRTRNSHRKYLSVYTIYFRRPPSSAFSNCPRTSAQKFPGNSPVAATAMQRRITPDWTWATQESVLFTNWTEVNFWPIYFPDRWKTSFLCSSTVISMIDAAIA
jgi:hypothetical protein